MPANVSCDGSAVLLVYGKSDSRRDTVPSNDSTVQLRRECRSASGSSLQIYSSGQNCGLVSDGRAVGARPIRVACSDGASYPAGLFTDDESYAAKINVLLYRWID